MAALMSHSLLFDSGGAILAISNTLRCCCGSGGYFSGAADCFLDTLVAALVATPWAGGLRFRTARKLVVTGSANF